MAKSSGNFQPSKGNAMMEQWREFFAKYILPKLLRQQNFMQKIHDPKALFDKEMEAKRKGGRAPKFEKSLFECVINLNENHTENDVKKVCEMIEKKFNVYVTSFTIHRDEGVLKNKKNDEILRGGKDFFTDQNGDAFWDKKYEKPIQNLDDFEVLYNYHSHINLMTYKDGKQNWRQAIVRPKLKEFQSELATILGMERGKENSRATRLTHQQMKQFYDKSHELLSMQKEQNLSVKELEKIAENHFKNEEKIVKSSVKIAQKINNNSFKNDEIKALKEQIKNLENELKNTNKNARNELQNSGAVRKDYAQLEQENRNLKNDLSILKNTLKSKNFDIQNMQNNIQNLHQKIEEFGIKNSKKIEEKNEEIRRLMAKNKKLEEEKKELEMQVQKHLKVFDKLDDLLLDDYEKYAGEELTFEETLHRVSSILDQNNELRFENNDLKLDLHNQKYQDTQTKKENNFKF